jgi:hypothetical protein
MIIQFNSTVVNANGYNTANGNNDVAARDGRGKFSGFPF